MRSIYLDNNATTAVLPEVAAAISASFAAGHANPASQHQPGRTARRVVEQAREQVARLLGANTSGMRADRVIFSSGGTEANNLALTGQVATVARRWPRSGDRSYVTGLIGDRIGRVIVSSIEHPSVLGPAESLRRRGWDVQTARVTRDGIVDVDHLVSLLTDDTRLVSVMLGNNETGVLQPVAEIVARCRPRGIPVHTDAVQVAGKLPIRFTELGVSAMTIAAHKFHGPRGIGALLLRHDVSLDPLLVGGFQQLGLRPGTESVELIVGLCKALEIWDRDQAERCDRLTRLRDRFESRLLSSGVAVVINGANAPRLPHTSNVAFPGRDRQALLMALDLAGVACSTGSACASGSSDPSPVLLAMGLPKEIVDSSLRFSLGALTTEADIDEAVARIVSVVSRAA